ncbi:hypothetical protein HGM15179_015971, partial [Zosterops borbonicus]
HGKFLHGQELAHPLRKGSLDMTGRRGRRNLDSHRRRRPLLRPGGASGASVPPRPPARGDAASPAPGPSPAAM